MATVKDRPTGASADGRTPLRIDGYAPIGDYAVVGDGRTVALIAADGAIDWLAMPDIGSEPLLDALLDAEQGHRFRLKPVGDASVTRRYLPETNVLETTFQTDGGIVRVTDAFTTDDGEQLPWLELVRSVECISGSIELEWELSTSPRAQGRLELHSWDAGEGSFELTEGGRALFALVFVVDGPLPAPGREDVERRLDGTVEWWKRWVERHEYDGPWGDEVLRSALVLRLLTHTPTGAMAAAATTSLPEKIGGDRNWDYRFSWVRDSSFALDALLRIGRLELVHSALRWLLDAVSRTHPRLNVLYDLHGDVPDSSCEELPLAGYRGSRPVRKGNTAAPQLQLGCYGDLLDTVWLYVKNGNDLGPDVARRIAEVASYTCRIWENEDSGIWELDDLQHYTSSKMDCWVALDRALRLAGRGAIPDADADLWASERERIHVWVEERCWSERRSSYTFYAGTDDLDTSVLLASRTGFADAKGDRMAGTIAAIREELVEGPFVYRYSGARDLEGAFLACSFWLVQALARAGRLDEATGLMDRAVALSNDVGIFSEEIDPSSGELLGNTPQALTHLALIEAAGAVEDMRKEEPE